MSFICDLNQQKWWTQIWPNKYHVDETHLQRENTKISNTIIET